MVMCGRYAIHVDIDSLSELFDANASNVDYLPRYNVAPTESAPVVLNAKKDPETGLSPGRVIEMCRWGLIPSWSTDASMGAKMINARSESLSEKSAFRKAFESRRCIVPVSGFYEWKQNVKRRKGDPPLQPIYARPVDGEVFGLAGLWELWRPPGGELLKSFTIVTVPANDVLAKYHERMPAILTPDAQRIWLDPAEHNAGLLESVLRPMRSNVMQVYPVTPAVNTAGVDDPSFVERVDVVSTGTLSIDF